MDGMNSNRNLTKPCWKMLYRMHRIRAREAEKATADAMIYGSGFLKVSASGEALHVPWLETQVGQHELR
jgi:hypothetical protein